MPPHEVCVVLLSVRKARCADAASRGGAVVLLEKTLQLALRRLYLRLDGLECTSAQLRAPIGGEARRKRLEGREQRALRARLLRLRAHVTDRPFDGHLWLRKAGADATRHVRGLGRVVRGERLEPGEPGLGVVLRDERRAERRVIGGRVEPIPADERDALLVEDEACERDIDPVGEEGMIERVGTRQGRRADRRQAIAEAEQPLLPLGHGRRRVVRPASQRVAVPSLTGAHRIEYAHVRVEVAHDRSEIVGRRQNRQRDE